MATIRLTRGDSAPPLVVQFQDEAGAIVDLLAADKVNVRLAPRGGAAAAVLAKAATVDAVADKATATLTGDDLDLAPGMYLLTAERDVGGLGTTVQTADALDVEIVDVQAFNHLANPSFESDLASWTSAGVGPIAADTAFPRFGVKSAKFNVATQGAANATTLRQTVALIPVPLISDQVMFSVYVLAASLEATWGRYRIVVDGSKDGGTTWVAIQTGAWQTTVAEWRRLTAGGAVVANTTHLRVTLEQEGGGVVYWDGAQLEAGARATPFRAA